MHLFRHPTIPNPIHKFTLFLTLVLTCSSTIAGASSISSSISSLSIPPTRLAQRYISFAATSQPEAAALLAHTPFRSRKTRDIVDIPLQQRAERALTNAKRLSLGLPLRPPRRRSAQRASRTTPHVARADPSSLPPTRFNIQARDTSTDALLGYVQIVSGFGHSELTPNQEEGLIVTLPSLSAGGGVIGPISIPTLNGPNYKYPFIGAGQGYPKSDPILGAELLNYIWIISTAETSPNIAATPGGNLYGASTKMESYTESAIWYYDTSTGRLTPQWINPGLSSPPTYLGYQPGTFLIVGDKELFLSVYNDVPTDWVYFIVVPVPWVDTDEGDGDGSDGEGGGDNGGGKENDSQKRSIY